MHFQHSMPQDIASHCTASAAGASSYVRSHVLAPVRSVFASVYRFFVCLFQRKMIREQPCQHRLHCDHQIDRRGGGLGFIFRRICGAGRRHKRRAASSQHRPEKAASLLCILSSVTCRCFAEQRLRSSGIESTD